MQTLITLNLEFNQITDEGAQHLANALYQNRVRLVLYSSISYASLSFNTDTYYIESWTKLYH